mmetsp:Transcript_12105/g.35096  ORF Transcript_12105/g.35096 Transcript_12105/m.35096 type:complete len:302 (-) Transcript_12105:536-1441(-)
MLQHLFMRHKIAHGLCGGTFHHLVVGEHGKIQRRNALFGDDLLLRIVTGSSQVGDGHQGLELLQILGVDIPHELDQRLDGAQPLRRRQQTWVGGHQQLGHAVLSDADDLLLLVAGCLVFAVDLDECGQRPLLDHRAAHGWLGGHTGQRQQHLLEGLVAAVAASVQQLHQRRWHVGGGHLVDAFRAILGSVVVVRLWLLHVLFFLRLLHLLNFVVLFHRDLLAFERFLAQRVDSHCHLLKDGCQSKQHFAGILIGDIFCNSNQHFQRGVFGVDRCLKSMCHLFLDLCLGSQVRQHFDAAFHR